MKKSVSMHIVKSLQSLKNYVSDFNVLQLFQHHEFEHIFFHVFEDEIELVVVFDDFVEFYDIGMVQLLQNFNLIKVYTLIPTGVLLFDELDGDDLLRLLVDGFDDRAEAAVT